MIAVALSVLITYLVHSTLFVAVVALATLALRRQPNAANRLWRLALVAPLVSTALAFSLPDSLRVGTVSLAAPAALAPEPPIALGDPGLEAGLGGASSSAAPMSGQRPDPARAPLAGSRISSPSDDSAGSSLAGRWPLALLALLSLLAVGRLALLAGRMILFRRGLRGRTPILEGRAYQRLAQLCRQSHEPESATAALRHTPRLTVCPKVLVPMALGNAEICLPAQALDGLPDAELDAVLAHELGHLERGDNRWLTLATALEALLFFQPLVGVVRRRLQETAELACDERAVELTGSARALARSLAEVAAWNLGGDLSVPVSAMAHRGGLLLRRVETLLAEAGRSRRRLRPATVRALVLAFAAVGLSISGVGLRLGGVDAALAAPARVTAQVPKATAVADRFPSPPAVAEADIDRRPGRPPRVAGAAPPAFPVPPIPPLPPPTFLEPMGDLLHGVMSGIVPQALSAAGKLGPLAGRQASLEIRRDQLRDRRSRGSLTAEESHQLAEVEKELVRNRQELKEAERKLEAEMEAAGKEFERTHGKEWEAKMEKWGEAYGKSMEKWGEQFGKDMEKWGEQFGKDMERWGQAFGQSHAARPGNPAAPRPKTEAPAKPAD